MSARTEQQPAPKPPVGGQQDLGTDLLGRRSRDYNYRGRGAQKVSITPKPPVLISPEQQALQDIYEPL